jgi:hypothetical protein
LLPAMLHVSPTHHETSKHVSPYDTDSRVEPLIFLDSNSNQGKSITHHKSNQGQLGFSIPFGKCFVHVLHFIQTEFLFSSPHRS